MDYFGPHIFGYLIALIHTLGSIAAIHAVLTVRTAQGSIAWALSLIFIPYLTLIPYLVFGRSTFDGYIKARRQANEQMRQAISELNWRPWVEEALTARASNAYDSLRAMPKLGRMPCLANNEVQLLVNGTATLKRAGSETLWSDEKEMPEGSAMTGPGMILQCSPVAQAGAQGELVPTRVASPGKMAAAAAARALVSA